jgi:hypothetical protein
MRWISSLAPRTSAALALLLCLVVPGARAASEQGIILQTSPLAGFQYHAGRALFPLMQVGDRLSLHREADNPHDAKAVRVEWRGAMIGYAPRLDNVDLARLMDKGLRVEGRILHLQKARDPWKRVLFEVLIVDAPSSE